MSAQEQSAPQVRERVWVTKIDHSVDPPRLIEEVFIENGKLISVTPLSPPEEQSTEG